MEASNNWTLQSKRNTRRLMIWTFSWTLSVALATFGPMFIWGNSTITVLVILLNIGLGVGMILANKIYLKGLDEMQQRIQLEAMAISLGVGLVGGIAYTLLDITNLISQDAEISFLIILMGITYMLGIVVGQIRYR